MVKIRHFNLIKYNLIIYTMELELVIAQWRIEVFFF